MITTDQLGFERHKCVEPYLNHSWRHSDNICSRCGASKTDVYRRYIDYNTRYQREYRKTRKGNK